jgi:peptidoglycan/xylan/chitin deacetylase (PgdA/CDA1 family)
MNAFIITVDTEGDDLWSGPENITTRNAEYLPRFQELCEKYHFKPTWLVNFEMSNNKTFQELAKGMIGRNAGEVGLHLHAWNSPPIYPLEVDDHRLMPYLIDYPENVMREKIQFLKRHLEDIFGVEILSHRAGRWALDDRYVRLLNELGFLVDCSVTPGVNWSRHSGAVNGRGSDYSRFPTTPYRMNDKAISEPGNLNLIQVPMTIRSLEWPVITPIVQHLDKRNLLRRATNKIFRELAWLRPDGRNLRAMLKLQSQVYSEGAKYLQFMLHSSEFMPGGSPTFSTEREVDLLYRDLEILFLEISKNWTGTKLSEFARRFASV